MRCLDGGARGGHGRVTGNGKERWTRARQKVEHAPPAETVHLPPPTTRSWQLLPQAQHGATFRHVVPWAPPSARADPAPSPAEHGKAHGGPPEQHDGRQGCAAPPAAPAPPLIRSPAAVADAVRTSLGPRGMDKMIQTAQVRRALARHCTARAADPFEHEQGEVIITNDGATILKHMAVMHPAARMVSSPASVTGPR